MDDEEQEDMRCCSECGKPLELYSLSWRLGYHVEGCDEAVRILGEPYTIENP